MKKKLLLSFLIGALMLASASVGAFAATKMKLVVDGQTAAVEPKLIDGVTYVPLRAAAEMLNATVNYDKPTNTVTITSKGSSAAGFKPPNKDVTTVPTKPYDVTLTFPVDRYPLTAAHIAAAIAEGESAICTIDRDGADENRDEALAGIPTKEGYDRDEWPMAMCAEGGNGADVAYVDFSDNRGSGAWVGNQLEEYPDGTRVLFVLSGKADGPVLPAEKAPVNTRPADSGATGGSTTVKPFASCAEARAAGAAPVRVGDPGYSKRLDRDGDGIGCE